MTSVQYSMVQIPLDVAGERDFRFPGAYLLFQNALRADGSQELNSVVSVRIGKDGVDFAPWRTNNRLKGAFDMFTVRWASQPGVTAFFYVAQEPNLLELESPPATQLVTSAVGSSFTHGAVSVLGTATLIKAANSLRQSVTVQNLGAANLYLGGGGVTAANGIKVPPGASVDISKTTAAIYGVSDGANIDARYWEDAS